MKNALNWFEIPAQNLQRSQKFYETILNTQMETMDMPELKTSMAIFPSEWTNEGVGGSIAVGEGQEPSSSGSTIYLNAGTNLESALSQVEAAGGQILQAKTSIGESGFIALFLDTEGNRVGLHSLA